MRARLAIVVVTMFAVVLAACGGDDVAADEGRLTVSGLVTLTPPDGGARILDRGQTVEFGDLVRVDEGTATLELATGDLYELRAGSGDVEPTTVLVGAPPRVVSGDILLSDGFPLSVAVADAVVTARGPAQVRSGSPTVASYAGATQIDGVPGVAEVKALRAVRLEAEAVPAPISYDGDDAWDRRYLGEAHAFGERLESLSRGYTAELQTSTGLSTDFYASVLPALEREPGFTDDLLEQGRPAGEVLVGAAIAVSATDGTFRDRWTAIFDFRSQGASWGLVALEQGVSATPLLDSIELAVGASPLSDDPRDTTTTTTTVPPDEPASPTSDPEPPPSSSPPPDTTPPTTGPEPEPEGLLQTVLEPVGALLDELLGVLGLGRE